MTRSVLLTKTELFDCIRAPYYLSVLTIILLLPAEAKFEQITQNRNIDYQLFALDPHDFSQNTEIQDREFKYSGVHLLQSQIFKCQQSQLLQSNFYFKGNFDFKIRIVMSFKYVLQWHKSPIFTNGVDQKQKCLN
ncbi:Hypothetical_protein [Hexamita inflata]|uniref:Hypothetical_protein n=1 Tax=Hexamita inflata TaxID=28002 RepID=A0AA86NSD6_9EUKA|nr:Hypothetical protein HINF_LOCUS12805 [Hexamita inflata]